MTVSAAKVWLKPGREKSLRRKHPWVFSGAIERVDGQAEPGTTVDLVGADGAFLAQAAFSPKSQIRARAWTFDRDERIDPDWFRARLARAIESRRVLGVLEPKGACMGIFNNSNCTAFGNINQWCYNVCGKTYHKLQSFYHKHQALPFSPRCSPLVCLNQS